MLFSGQLAFLTGGRQAEGAGVARLAAVSFLKARSGQLQPAVCVSDFASLPFRPHPQQSSQNVLWRLQAHQCLSLLLSPAQRMDWKLPLLHPFHSPFLSLLENSCGQQLREGKAITWIEASGLMGVSKSLASPAQNAFPGILSLASFPSFPALPCEGVGVSRPLYSSHRALGGSW